jgi:hypothetical protein
MTNNQQQIINSLISEFDKINKQTKSGNNLVDFINSQLDEIAVKKQEFREQTRIAKIINDELSSKLTDDITDLLFNFGYTLKVNEYQYRYDFTITFVGERCPRYNDWEYAKYYAHKHTANFDDEKGLAKGGFQLECAKSVNMKKFRDTNELLKDIAEHIVKLKKRKL